MNRPIEQNQQKSQTNTSTLISLFEQKGYECKEINEERETIYVMKFEPLEEIKPSEPKPKIVIN